MRGPFRGRQDRLEIHVALDPGNRFLSRVLDAQRQLLPAHLAVQHGEANVAGKEIVAIERTLAVRAT